MADQRLTEAGRSMLLRFADASQLRDGYYAGAPVKVLRIGSFDGAQIGCLAKLQREGLVIVSKVPGGRNAILTERGNAKLAGLFVGAT